jgi:hypothetical protein
MNIAVWSLRAPKKSAIVADPAMNSQKIWMKTLYTLFEEK